MLRTLALLAAAGALGTLARYGLGGVVQRILGGGFPWGTLCVNLMGCLLFGLVWPLAEEQVRISPESRRIILIGFMGAFTTFSTFAFETGQMVRDSEWMMAAANVAASNVLGIAALMLGMALGRML
jgi:CrcB protein